MCGAAQRCWVGDVGVGIYIPNGKHTKKIKLRKGEADDGPLWVLFFFCYFRALRSFISRKQYKVREKDTSCSELKSLVFVSVFYTQPHQSAFAPNIRLIDIYTYISHIRICGRVCPCYFLWLSISSLCY